MANFKYEGTTENINEIQLKFIGEVLEKRGFSENTKVVIEDVGVAGDNYIANVKRITVENDAGKPFKMIAKIAPTHEQIRLASNTHKLFENEKIMYTEILPKFRQLQNAAEIPKEDIFRYVECYGCNMEAPYEIILLEDLKESNFEMLDRFESLPDECIKSVLKNLAILHSLSFVLKHKEPQKFDEYGNKLFDMWKNPTPEVLTFFNLLENHVLQLLSDNEQRKAIFNRVNLSQFGSFAPKLIKTALGTKQTTIQQGDTWTNNIMFKFADTKLLQSVMIDYQVSKEANPTYDLMYLIFNCTDHGSRMKHYYDWIDHYHMELDKALENYGLKSSYIYPKDQLDADLKRYGKLMFCLSVMLSSVMTLNSEEATKAKEFMEQSNKDFELDSVKDGFLGAADNIRRFKSRIEGLIDSFAEFGLL